MENMEDFCVSHNYTRGGGGGGRGGGDVGGKFCKKCNY